MAADALAPYVARTWAAMILTIEYVSPCLTLGRILSTCVMSVWNNDIKCEYKFMFPLKNLARKGLTGKYSLCYMVGDVSKALSSS